MGQNDPIVQVLANDELDKFLVGEPFYFLVFCLSKKRAQPDAPYADLFEIDMGGVAVALKWQLEINKADLIADTRWAGAAWNSQNGMWDPLMRTALMVRDKLGGPDFVPANI